MNRKLLSDLDDAFSLLPAAKARQAIADVLDARNAGKSYTLPLKWSEHTIGGAFIRGGVSDLVSHRTRVLPNSQDDMELRVLATLASNQTVLEGYLVILHGKERFAWFLPYQSSRADQVRERTVRGMIVTQPIFSHVIDLIHPHQTFTDAERRVMFQVTAGMSLRDAAAHDEVSFETKRAQLKSVCSKLGCAGQKDLVRLVLGQLVHLLSATQTESVHGEPAEEFLARYLAEDARLEIRRLPNGRALRVMACGPSNGRPVVVIHGMMFPITLVGISRHLEATGIRLLIPIRTGFLESRTSAELAGKDDFIEESFADLAEFIRTEFRTAVPVLGQSLGAVLAVRFASKFPELVSRLLLQSINLTQHGQTGYANTFYSSLKRLSREPDLMKLVNWQFHKYYADPATGRTILSRLFGASRTDMEVLDGKVTGREAYRLFADLYVSSVFGINNDFNVVMGGWMEDMRKLKVRATFIHGDSDPLTEAAEFLSLVGEGNAHRSHIIAGGGHFIAASHARHVWQAVAEQLAVERKEAATS